MINSLRTRDKTFIGKVFVFLVALKKKVFYLTFLQLKYKVLGIIYLFSDLFFDSFSQVHLLWEDVVVLKDQNLCYCMGGGGFMTSHHENDMLAAYPYALFVTCLACIAHTLVSSDSPIKLALVPSCKAAIVAGTTLKIESICMDDLSHKSLNKVISDK